MDSVVFDLGGVVLDRDRVAILAGYYADPALRAQLQAAAFEHADGRALDRGTLDENALILRLAKRTGRPVPELQGLLAASRDSLQPKAAPLDLIEHLMPAACRCTCCPTWGAHVRAPRAAARLVAPVPRRGDLEPDPPSKPEARDLRAFCWRRTPGWPATPSSSTTTRPNLEAAAALGIRSIGLRDAAQCERELDALLDAAGEPS